MSIDTESEDLLAVTLQLKKKIFDLMCFFDKVIRNIQNCRQMGCQVKVKLVRVRGLSSKYHV